MKRFFSPVFLMAFLMVIAASVALADHRVTQSALDETIANWGAKQREAANTLISKYGLPNEATPTMLIWHDNGPWKRTILWRDEIPHNFPKPHTDFLEQFVEYRVPVDKFDDLARYDGSVIAERTKGELSARCDKEEMNFLALNLAVDVATGRRSVDDARRFYTEAAMAAMKGEMPLYTRGLQFQQVARADDPDSSTTHLARGLTAEEIDRLPATAALVEEQEPPIIEGERIATTRRFVRKH